MACRKAADRALTEVAEWKARQDEQMASVWRRMELRLKPKWMFVGEIDVDAPPNGVPANDASVDSTSMTGIPEPLSSSVLCYSWLEDGWERGPACGCNGGCGKEHPRVVLHFDDYSNSAVVADDKKGAVATLSHPLKPFLDYFNNLCEQNLAFMTQKRMIYRLQGYLKEHVGRLEAQTGFGYHLVKVTTEALTASRRAQEAHQKACDEAEQQAIAGRNKKRKRNQCGTKFSSPAHSKSLMEQAFCVMWDNHWFQDNLDLLDIHYWRMSGIVSSDAANRLAHERMQALRLAFRVLLEREATAGMPRARRHQALGINYDQMTATLPYGRVRVETRHPEGYASLTGLLSECRLQMFTQDAACSSSIWALRSNENGDPEIGCYPCVPVNEILQRTATAVPSSSWKTGSSVNEVDNNQHDSQVGFVVQVFLEGYHFVKETHTQRMLMTDESSIMGCLLEVARYRIEAHSPTDDRVNYSFSWSDSELGKFLNIKSLLFSFEDLVGIYVRRKLFASRAVLRKLQNERPASHVEKDYVRRWARAAREHVPGHARDFEGLQGWDVDNS